MKYRLFFKEFAYVYEVYHNTDCPLLKDDSVFLVTSAKPIVLKVLSFAHKNNLVGLCTETIVNCLITDHGEPKSWIDLQHNIESDEILEISDYERMFKNFKLNKQKGRKTK